MAHVQLNKNQRRKLSIFLKCLLFSFIAWVLFAVSNTYVFQKPVRLEYINLPDNRAFQTLQADSALIHIEATGWQLLFSSLQDEDRAIQVDLNGLRNRSFITLPNQLGFINRQFPASQRVVSVQPDTLFFDFTSQREKRVPVEVVTALTYARQFGMVGPITVDPAYVTVRGAAEDVREITAFATAPIKGSGIQESLVREVALDGSHHPNLRVYPEKVRVEIPVGEMTEKEMQIPVEVINGDKYRSVKVLPSKVTVTLMVSLDDFANIGTDSIRMVVDMKDWESSGASTLAVKPLRIPTFSKLLRIQPQNVDFYVNK